MKQTKIISILLTLVLLLMIPAANAAEKTTSGTYGDNLSWTLDSNGLLTISGTGPMRDSNSSNSYQKPFSSASDVITVVIEDGVTSIGASCFARCVNMTSITLPDSINSIGRNAFESCKSLTTIDIPEGVTTIARSTFDVCSSLTTVTLPESLITIEESAFNWCESLTGITIPRNLTSIHSGAFCQCYSLAGFWVDKNNPCFTSDENGVMYNKDKTELFLVPRAISTHFVIPDSVTVIGNDAFNDCVNLAGVTIPSGVTTIGDAAFMSCQSLTEIEIPDAVTSIGISAFCDCRNLTSIVIPDGVTAIAEVLFFECHALTSVTIPDSVTTIENDAFSYCTSLESIAIPESVTSIGSSAFSECSSLTCFKIPNGVTKIEWFTFYNCPSLTDVFIPAGVTVIDATTFASCNSLKNVFYEGSAAQKESIEIGDSNSGLVNATWHYEAEVYYSDGQQCITCPDCDSFFCLDSIEAQPTLTGKTISLSFEDEILLNFYFEAQNVQSDDLGMLVFYTNPGTADIAAADEVYSDAVYDVTSGRYMSQTTGIAAKEMGDTRYYAAYAKCSDGTYVYSDLYNYSPKKYALSRLEKSTDENMKALCVAMLNYGAAAQSYFGYKTDDLMNASLIAEQQALVKTYSADLFAGAVAADSSKVGEFVKTESGFSRRKASVSFEGAFAINYYFAPDADMDGDITFYYWTPEAYAAADLLTVDNASGKMTMVDAGDGSYWAQITGISAKQLDDTFYVAAVYTSDSSMRCTGIVPYSLSKYCLNHAVDGNEMQELSAATAIYGYHAKAYFA